MFWCGLDFVFHFSKDPISRDTMSPFVSLPIAFAGAVMMLVGVGEWKRWAYLWVFLSMPI
jgi:hypothetical protein